MTRLFLFLLLCCGSSLLSSCSFSFGREWREAVRKGPKPGLQGAWEGTWKSDINGHNGRLRCVVGPAKNKEGDHSFHYRATWAKVLSGGYRVDHRVTGPEGDWKLEGQHRLPGWAGGLYTYKGTVKGDDFSARYDCELDEGVFTMKRIKQ